MNGPMVDTDFTIKTSMGDNIGRCSDRNHRWSRLEYFIFMFPPAQLNLMVNEANVQLEKENKQHTTKGEVLKFIGMCILITRFEFGNRSTLWSTTAPSKCIPAASLGSTGMKRHRFDDLWKHMRFSQQPDQRPEGIGWGSTEVERDWIEIHWCRKNCHKEVPNEASFGDRVGKERRPGGTGVERGGRKTRTVGICMDG